MSTLARRRFRIVVVLVSVAGAAIGSVWLATGHSSEAVTTRGVSAILRVPGHPGSLAAGRDAVWLTLADAKPPARDQPLLRLDPASGAIERSVLPGGQATFVTHLGNRVIAAIDHVGDDGLGPSRLIALDWRTGSLLVRRGFEGPVGALAGDGKILWALQVRPAALLRLDARTLAPAAQPLPLGIDRADGLAVGGGYVWVTAADAGDLLRIEPGQRAVRRVHVGGAPVGIVVAGGRVWYADRARGEVGRLDPRTLRADGEPIDAGAAPSWMGAAGRYLFVGEAEGTLRRIDVATARQAGPPIQVAGPARGSPPFAVAPAGTAVWVSSFAANSVTRVSATSAAPSARPVTASSAPDAAAALPALPRGGRVVARIAVPSGSGGFAVGAGAVWAMNDLTTTLLRIDPKRNAVVARIHQAVGGGVAAGEGAVWITHPIEGTVARIDPRTNRPAATIRVGPQPAGIAVSRGAVWVANAGGPSVARIDPATDRVVATIRIGPRRACCGEHMAVTTGGGAVWATVANENTVVRIDPATNRVTHKVRLAFPPCGFLAADRAAVWSAAASCGEVVGRVDGRTRRVAGTVKGEPHAIGLALAFGSLWVAGLDLKTVDRIDPHTHRIAARLPIVGQPIELGVGFGSVWVHDDTGSVLRIRPRGSP